MKTSLSRLGIITVFAVLVALVYRQDGWAVFVGLVIFQLVMMALLIKPLRRVSRAVSAVPSLALPRRRPSRSATTPPPTSSA